MIYDVPDVTDYGEAIDVAEQKLSDARRERDDAMATLEASRRGHNPLSKSEYSDQSVRHSNAENGVRRQQLYLLRFRDCHFGMLSSEWMHEQADLGPDQGVTARKASLAQVWQRWRDVLAARQALADLEVKLDRPERKYFEDDYGNDVPGAYVGTVRERIEAQVAMNRAEGLYDLVLRAFEGRQPRTHEQTLRLRVSKPTKALPPKRIIKTPTKYVRGPNGIAIPLELRR